ncbi:MAG TPA: helix-turn-helix transcriptional regulator [Planctomycetota bacterium]
MDTIVTRFAERLRNLRDERHMTQEELAARAGLHPGYVSSLERGAQIPRLTVLEQLAKGLGTEIRALVDFPHVASRKSDKVRDEITMIASRLEKSDLATVRRIRRAVEALTD